jgi:hypothetical protein
MSLLVGPRIAIVMIVVIVLLVVVPIFLLSGIKVSFLVVHRTCLSFFYDFFVISVYVVENQFVASEPYTIDDSREMAELLHLKGRNAVEKPISETSLIWAKVDS